MKTVSLTKTFRIATSEIAAVNDVSLEVDGPKFAAIVGASGSGKSTLLNLVGLNDLPTSGRIFIDGVDVSRLSERQRRKMRLLHMGFVFQTFNLLPTLNALENVELPMALAGKSQNEQKEKAYRLLEAVGLGKRTRHRPKELSMGEMQRVAIARALANDPEIIVADEPTGELDSKTSKEIIGLLSEISKRDGKLVVVATHDEKLVKVADVVYTIEDGNLKLGN